MHSTCRDWTLLDLGSACLPQIVPSGVWNSPPGRNATTLAPLHIGASPCGLLAPPPHQLAHFMIRSTLLAACTVDSPVHWLRWCCMGRHQAGSGVPPCCCRA